MASPTSDRTDNSSVRRPINIPSTFSSQKLVYFIITWGQTGTIRPSAGCNKGNPSKRDILVPSTYKYQFI